MKKFITLLAVLLFMAEAFAQTISIQGVLRDPNGRSVDDGSYSVVFKIYDAETGGTELWTDTYASLQTKHGVFQVNLGENATLDGLAFDQSYYVGVTVENFAEMTPRIQLTIYPYSKAILGQNNKFPSTGDVVLTQDNFVIQQGELKLEGASGLIRFNDGTTLNSANFGGPAGSLANPTDANINADMDADASGAINFQTGGTTRATIANDGSAVFEGTVNAKINLSSGTHNTSLGNLNLYGADAGSAFGGTLNLFTSDTRTTEKWFLQPQENNLILGYENGGSFPTVATFGSASTVFNGSLAAQGNNIFIGEDHIQRGILTLWGAGTGSSNGGRIDFFKAADHDGDGSPMASEYWFMEAINDDLRIGNIFSNNDVMTFNQLNYVGIGAGATNPTISLAIGDHDTGINHAGDGNLSIVTNGSNVMYFSPAGNVGIGDNSPDEAKLVINGSPGRGHDVNYAYSASAGSAASIQNWPSVNGGNASFFANFSVWADGNYGGQGFVVFSDERIKEVIGKSDNAADLELLKKFNITDYSYIDKVMNGNKVEKKVIAQEVAEIYPQAISLNTNVVPNIYEVPKKTSYTNGSLKIKLNKAHTLNIGDKVQCFIENESVFLIVDQVKSDDTFTAAYDREPESIFIYGQEVDDFHTVDYDAISMLNVSATQELAKRTEAQEKRIATLEAENAELKQKLETISTLEAKVNALLGIGKEDVTLVGQK